jgi:hypothetical protein
MRRERRGQRRERRERRESRERRERKHISRQNIFRRGDFASRRLITSRTSRPVTRRERLECRCMTQISFRRPHFTR